MCNLQRHVYLTRCFEESDDVREVHTSLNDSSCGYLEYSTAMLKTDNLGTTNDDKADLKVCNKERKVN